MSTKTFKTSRGVADIPSSEVDGFLQEFPDAIEVNSFIVGKDTADVPLDDIDGFLKAYPKAKPLRNYFNNDIDASFGLNDIPGVKERLDKAKPIESQEQYVKGLLEPNKTRPQQEALTEYARTAAPMTSIFETKKGNIVVPTNDKEQFQKQNPEAKEVNLSKSPGELYKEEQVNIARQKGELLETLSSKIDEFDTKYSELLASQPIQERPDLAISKTSLPPKQDPKLALIGSASSILHSVDEMLKAPKSGGLMSGMGNKSSIVNAMTLGLSELGSGMIKLGIAQKIEEGKELLPEEQDVVDAVAIAAQAGIYANPSRMYKAGMTVTEAIPFLAQMGITGGIRKAITSAITKSIEKKVAGTVLKKGGGKLITWGAKRITEAPGAIAGTLAQETLSPMPYADYGERRLGDVEYNKETGKGEVKQTGDKAKSLFKSGAYGFSEMFFEGGGEVFNSLGKEVLREPLQKLGQKFFMKALNNPNALLNMSKGLQKATKFDGLAGELLEEELTGVAESILVGDQTLDEFFNSDQQIDLALGVAAMSGTFKLTEVPGVASNLFNTKNKQRTSYKFWEDKNIPDDIKYSIDNIMQSDASIEDKKTALRQVDISGVKDDNKAQSLISQYVVDALQWQVNEGLADASFDIQNEKIRNKETGNIHTAEDFDGNTWYVVDEDNTGLLISVNPETGETEMKSKNDFRVFDIINYQQAKADRLLAIQQPAIESTENAPQPEQILSNPQKNDIIPIEGKNYIVENVSGENIPGTTEVQNPGPNTTTQLPGQQEPSINNTYPLDKDGNPDLDNMDEIQLFNYNKETNGEETAIADLNGDISQITDKIAKAQKKLESADTKTKIKGRIEIKTLQDKKAKLENLLPKDESKIDETSTIPDTKENTNSNIPEAGTKAQQPEAELAPKPETVEGEASATVENINNLNNKDNGKNVQGIPKGKNMAEKRPKEINPELPTNPDEIVNTWKAEKENAPINKLAPWEVDALGYKTTGKSFAEFNDKNNMSQTLAKMHISNTKGIGLDVIAQQLSEQHGLNIEPGQVAELFVRHATEKGMTRKTTDLQKELENQYKIVTGNSIKNHKFASTIEGTWEQFVQKADPSWFGFDDALAILEQNKDQLTPEQYEQFRADIQRDSELARTNYGLSETDETETNVDGLSGNESDNQGTGQTNVPETSTEQTGTDVSQPDTRGTSGLEGISGTTTTAPTGILKDEQNLIQSSDPNVIELVDGNYNFKDNKWLKDDAEVTNPVTIGILNTGQKDLIKMEAELRAKGRPEKSIQTMLSMLRDQIKNYQEEPINSEGLDQVAKKQEIDQKAHEAATSPNNDLPEPTEAQKEAINYKLGHIRLHGLDISIENPKDSKRTGTDEDGKVWETTMQNHYGYIRETKGRDKDHVDVFIGNNPESSKAFVVDQVNPKTGKFDEHKVLLGFNSQEEAQQAYLNNYEPGWQGLGAITEMPVNEFKTWVKDEKNTKKPLGDLSNKETTIAPKVVDNYTDQNSPGPLTDQQIKSTPKTPKDYIIKQEKEPYSKTGYAWRVYEKQSGEPIGMGAETKDEVESKLREFENVNSIEYYPINSELTPLQQSELDKQLSEIDGQIEEANKRIASTKKAREKKYAELNNRNGLFGDTKDQGGLFQDTFAPTPENISKALEPFDAEIRVANENLAKLNKLRQATIENAGKQGEINIPEKKEYWQKTKDEWLKSNSDIGTRDTFYNSIKRFEEYAKNNPEIPSFLNKVNELKNKANKTRYEDIKNAISEGKQVPENVLNDYPDLKGNVSEPSTPYNKDVTQTEAFKNWSGNAPILSGIEILNTEPQKPQVFKVYHGTTNEFDIFDPTIKGEVKSHFGLVNYFTSDENDANVNYAGMGPDLTNRIERVKEQLESDIQNEIEQDGFNEVKNKYNLPDEFNEESSPSEIAQHIARSKYHGGNEKVMELFVKLNNPLVINGKNKTYIEPYGEETVNDINELAKQQIKDENGIEDDELDNYQDDISDRATELLSNETNSIIEAAQQAAWQNGVDANIVIQALPEEIYYDSVSADVIDKSLRTNEELSYAEGENGELINNQIISDFYKYLGFDGIVLCHPKDQFTNMDIDPNASHVHVFSDYKTSIKSATDNKGTFDPNNPSIVSEPTIFTNEKGEVNEAIQTQLDWTETVSAKRNEAITSDPTQPDLQRKRGYSPDIDNGITYVERQLNEIGQISFLGNINGPAKIKSANDIAFLFKNLESAQAENVFAVLINKNGNYTVQYISTGTSTGSVVDSKQIIAAAKEVGASQIVLVHNHPSGNLKPSDQDVAIYDKLRQAGAIVGIQIHPSVIIDTDSGQYSQFEYNYPEISNKEDVKGKIIEPKILYFDKKVLYTPSNERTKITSSKAVAEYLSKQHRGTTNKLHILILDRANNINKYQLVDETMPFKELNSLLLGLVGKHGESVILASNNSLDVDKVNELKKSLKTIDAALLDVLHIKQNDDIINHYKSFTDEGILNEPEAKYQKSLTPELILKLKSLGEPDNILKTSFILPDGFKLAKDFTQTHDDIASKVGATKEELISKGVIRITPKGAEIRIKPTDNQITQLKAHIQAVKEAKSPYDLDIYNENNEHAHIHISRGQDIDAAIWQMNDFFDSKPVKYESPFAAFLNEPPSDYTTDNTVKEQPEEITAKEQKARKIRENFQDSMINTKKMQEGLKVSDMSNIYLADNQKNSRAQFQKETFDKQHFEPITKALKTFASKYGKQFHDKDFLKLQKDKERTIKNINGELFKGNITPQKATRLIKASEAKYKKDYDELLKTDIGHYMMAKHAPERNASLLAERKAGITTQLDNLKLADESGMMSADDLAKEEARLMVEMNNLNNITFDNDNLSGYSTNEANKIVSDFEAQMDAKDIQNFWDKIRSANEFTMQKWVDYGKFKEVSETIKNRNWQYYVPLRGWQEEYSELESDYVSKGEGEFGGTPDTKGRVSLADNPLANILNMAQSVIAWGEKNHVNQKAVYLAMANKDKKDVLHLYKVQYLKAPDKTQSEVVVEDGEVFELLGGYDKTGMPAKQSLGKLDELISKGYNLTYKVDKSYALRKPSDKAKQHLVSAYINGQKMVVVFNNENISNEINKSYVVGQIPVIAPITRVMSQLRTSYNPIFLVKNPIRDLSGGVRNTFIEQGVPQAAKLLMNYFANPVRYAAKDKKIRQYYDEFKKYGSRTGTTSLNSIDDFKDDIQKTMRTINHPLAMNILRSPSKLLGVIERLVYFSEISTRFAAYVTARENGETVFQSTNKAKEVSVNFDRKGNYSSGIGSIVQFYNATMQAAQKQASYATGKDTALKYWVFNGVMTAAAGYLLASLYDLMSDDDDETKRPGKFDRYNNIVLSLGNAKVSIPMAQGYRMFNAIGHIVYDLEHGYIDEKQASIDILENIQGAISPVEFTSIIDADKKDITPQSFAYGVLGNVSFVEPFFQYMANRDFRGQKIYREGFTDSQDKYLPNWERYTRYTNPFLINGTKALFQAGGGDLKGTNIKEGGEPVGSLWDWNPAAIDFMARAYGGGVGNMTLDILTKAAKEISGQAKKYETEIPEGKFDFSSWPIVNSFVRTKTKDYRFDEYRKASQWFEDMNSRYDALVKTNDISKITKEEFTPEFTAFKTIEYRIKAIKNVEKNINSLYAEIEKENDDTVIKDKLEQASAFRKYIYGLRNDIITTYENRTRLPETKEAQPEGDSE